MAGSLVVFVFIFYVTSLVLQALASDVWKQFAPIPEFDGKMCPVASIAFQIVVASQMFCSTLCHNNGLCLGVFYKAESGLCVGCSRFAFENGISLPNNAGTIYISWCLGGGDWAKFKGSTYTQFSDVKTAYDARADCLSRCSDLVSIESWEEQTFLQSWITVTYALTGLSKNTDGHWRWMNEQTQPTFSNWYPGQPEQGDEKCMVMDRKKFFKWEDYPCWGKYSYICERK